MRPRLRRHLLAYRPRKTPGPPSPPKRPVHVRARRLVHQVRPRPEVVVHGRQLDELAQEGDGALLAQVLVADDGLANGLGLRGRGAVGRGGEEVEGGDGAVEFEGQEGACEEGWGGADVVEEGGQGQGGRGEGGGVVGELLLENCGC